MKYFDVIFLYYRNAKRMPDYGKSLKWPAPPLVLQDMVTMLKKVHGR